MLIGFVVSVLLLIGIVRWANSVIDPPASVGADDGRLATCPSSPNCVSSLANASQHRVTPLQMNGTATESMRQLHAIIASMPRSRVVTADDDYLHAEFRSAVLGFVDDLELLVDETKGIIHVRSASRLGYSDLGANRRRVEQLRARYQHAAE